MFWSKKTVEPTEAPCMDCGCLVRRGKLHKVINSGGAYIEGSTFFRTTYNCDEYYCSRCKPPYDEVHHLERKYYYRIVPETRIEVDVKGKAIKQS